MVEPRSSIQPMVRDAMKKRFEVLDRIVADLLGGDVDPEVHALCRFSVLGQCLFYKHMDNRLIKHFDGVIGYTEETVDRISRHITEFSLMAIRAIRDREHNHE